MRRARLFLAALVLTSAAGGMLGAHAGHCGSGTGRPHDPFGSCENGPGGGTECGSAPQGLPYVPISQARVGNGIQLCLAMPPQLPVIDEPPVEHLPVGGRVGVWLPEDQTAVVFLDGDDATVVGSELGWTRADVDADEESCEVRVRHGESGQWANDFVTPGQTDSPTTSDDCHDLPS